MKFKTAELSGIALAWAVAKAEGRTDKRLKFLNGTESPPYVYVHKRGHKATLAEADSLFDYDSGGYYHPHTSWGLFGPVMEKHPWCLPRVNNVAATLHLGAYVSLTAGGFCYYGPTPLVAACRSYVACKLGGEVEVPDFLE